jgi:predicted Holliday junction resolvase-like endonuclease
MEFLKTFQSFRTILCICPKCNKIHRLSDLHLRYLGKTAKTWFDIIESKNHVLDIKTALFEEKERRLRDLSIARGRKKVSSVVQKLLIPQLSKFKVNPYDIKFVSHPIDYVVFEGLNDDNLNRILLLSKETKNQELQSIRKQIKNVIDTGNVEWAVARYNEGKIELE